jgi:hypothetical protein
MALAAPAAAAPNTSNTSGSADVLVGDWSGYDEASGVYTFGYAFAYQEKGGEGVIEIYEDSGKYVECPTKGGKKSKGKGGSGGDPGGTWGFQGTWTWGWGPATMSISGRGLDGANAAGTIFIETVRIDDCAGVWEIVHSGEAPVAMSLVGTGDVISFRGKDSVKIPGALNGHSSYRGKYREATGSIDFLSAVRPFSWAAIQTVSWTEHCNGTSC